MKNPFILKTIQFANGENEFLDKALRKYTADRLPPLDIASSVYTTPTDKFFIGYENEKSITVSRIKGYFGGFLPMIIVCFSKEKNFFECTFRLGMLSIIFLLFQLYLSGLIIFQGFERGEYAILVIGIIPLSYFSFIFS